MKNPQLDELQLVITKMMNEEYDNHAKLLATIADRKPSNEALIIDSLSAVHKARMRILENIFNVIKSLKDT